MPLLAAAGIGAAGSIIGGFLGSNASKKAAQIQQQNAQRVAGMATDAATSGSQIVDAAQGNAYNVLAGNQNGTGSLLAALYSGQMGMLNPYQAAGTQGITSLANMLQPGGELTQQFSFNPSDLENDPGYQFQLAQGQKALNASAAARGALVSGGALKAMSNYNQGLAGTSFQNAYNRALTTFQTNRSNTLQGLNMLIGAGQTANAEALQAGEFYGGTQSQNNEFYSGQQSNDEMIAAQLKAGYGLTAAQIAGSALTGGANAQAAGTVGSANAWNGAIGGITNAAQLYGLSSMMAQPRSYVDGSVPAGTPTGVPPGAMPPPFAPSYTLPPAPYVPAYAG